MIEEPELHPNPPPWRICGYCTKRFRPKTHEQKYCKPKHAEYARKRKQKQMGFDPTKAPRRQKRPDLQFEKGKCPTPEKRYHFTREQNAWRHLRDHSEPGEIGTEPLMPYHCGCGKWHFKTVTWKRRNIALNSFLEKGKLTWESL